MRYDETNELHPKLPRLGLYSEADYRTLAIAVADLDYRKKLPVGDLQALVAVTEKAMPQTALLLLTEYMSRERRAGLGLEEVPGYEKLAGALRDAYAQSATGKGKERHANDLPFDEQPILAIGRMCGMGYQTGQVQKKAQEATGMAARGKLSAARAEMLGVIVYAAAAVVLLDEMAAKAPSVDAATR